MNMPKMILFDYGQTLVADRIHRLLANHDFAFIITSSNYIFRKPSKRIFNLALEKAGCKPSETWYIGDQYECAIKGASNAGLFPIWYTGAIGTARPEDDTILTVTSWQKLMELMEE